MLRSLGMALTTAMQSWHQGKLFVEQSLTISHDTLHLLVGVLLWIVFGLVSGRPLTSLRPWLWLFAIILWNETVDLTVEHWPERGKQYGEGIKKRYPALDGGAHRSDVPCAGSAGFVQIGGR